MIRAGAHTGLGTLAAMDMDHFPRSINIGDLEEQPLLEAKPAGVHRREVGIIVEGVDLYENAFDLFPGQHRGEPCLPLCADDVEQMPVALEHMGKEELDAGVANAHRGGTPFGVLLAVDEVVDELLLGEEVRGLVVMLTNQTDGPDIGILGPLALAGDFKGFDHFLMPFAAETRFRFHGCSPFLLLVHREIRPRKTVTEKESFFYQKIGGQGWGQEKESRQDAALFASKYG